MGRPPLPADEVRRVVFTLRISEHEHEKILRAAKLSGKDPTRWARETLLASAEVVDSIEDNT